MLAGELTYDFIPPLKTSDTVQTAIERMEEFRVSHLPIVNEVELLGLLSDQDIIEIEDYQQPVGNQDLSLNTQSVYEDQHIYDVIRLVHEQRLSVVPVVNYKKQYRGLISMSTLVTYFAGLTALEHPGGILVLELGARDFQLSEIARIIESDNASVLSLYVRTFSDSTKMELTLKLNQTELTHIIASLERFNYEIKASFHQSPRLDDTMERFESFMHYLNI